MADGSPQQSADAFAMTLKNMLRFVCDPVAGLVEVPCVKRNAGGSSLAVVSAYLALAGVTSRIPCDEVIGAMYKIGKAMPVQLRETGEDGWQIHRQGEKCGRGYLGRQNNEGSGILHIRPFYQIYESIS